MHPVHPSIPLDFDACYRAASGRDTRWDGRLFLAVTSTKIYCKPSCPARKPFPENCRFFPSAAACVAAGFRACKRCRPDAVPGTRDWDVRGDLVARAVRRIRDGAVDAVGVAGLAAELAVSERHLRRLLLDEVGATPLQLARTRRAHAARTLLDETELSLTDIAFASGFGSLRQFGDTMREEFGVPPSQLARGSAGNRLRGASAENTGEGPDSDEGPSLTLRLRTRPPFDVVAMVAYLSAHAIPGRDLIAAGDSESDHQLALPTTVHAIDVPGGTGSVTIDWGSVVKSPHASSAPVCIPVTLQLRSLADTMPAIRVVRRLLDLDADPTLIGEVLERAAGGETSRVAARLARAVAARPGLRVAGARHGAEFALGTVLGQQVSLAAARTLQGRLAQQYGAGGVGEFRSAPDLDRLAAADPEALRAELGLTQARATTLHALATALASGLRLDSGVDREAARAALAAIKGIGPWSVEVIALRALGDPDAFPAGDLILRRACCAVPGVPPRALPSERQVATLAEPWRPYRAYAAQHLWTEFLTASPVKDHS